MGWKGPAPEFELIQLACTDEAGSGRKFRAWGLGVQRSWSLQTCQCCVTNWKVLHGSRHAKNVLLPATSEVQRGVFGPLTGSMARLSSDLLSSKCIEVDSLYLPLWKSVAAAGLRSLDLNFGVRWDT